MFSIKSFPSVNTDSERHWSKVSTSQDLPDGVFLSFDSILKSFFSSSVKNVLSPQSGQHPSTVFTRSPLSFLHSFSLFCLFLLLSLSFCLSRWKAASGGGCGLDGCTALRPSSVSRKLAPWSRLCCCCTKNKAKDRGILLVYVAVLRHEVTDEKKRGIFNICIAKSLNKI